MAKKATKKKRIERRPIDSLSPHPAQVTFGDLSQTELQELAQDIAKNGLINPMEICDDGTIICGHQRVQAALLLDWETIPCWVREDLEQQGDSAIEARLLEDNLHRRQLSDLAIARCYLRSKELALKNEDEREDGKEDLRDHLAKRFKKSGKQMERYAKMLDAPLTVQRAFESGKLSQKEVLAVVALDHDEQQQIAEQIGAGEIPKTVVKPFVQRQRDQEVGAETAVFRLARAVEDAERQIDGRLDEIRGGAVEYQLSKLAKGVRFIRSLHKSLKQKIEEEEREAIESLNEF